MCVFVNNSPGSRQDAGRWRILRRYAQIISQSGYTLRTPGEMADAIAVVTSRYRDTSSNLRQSAALRRARPNQLRRHDETLRYESTAALIRFNLPVSHGHKAFGAVRENLVVRDHHNRQTAVPVQLGEKIEDGLCIGGVKISGGLVGQ